MFSNQSKKDINGLKDEVSTLFDDLSSIVQSLTSIGKTEAGDVKKKIEKEISAKLEGMQDRVEELRRQGKKVAKTVQDHVEENPISSLLIACGVGYMLCKLLNRKD